MKTVYATFSWEVRIAVRDDFDENNPDHVAAARNEAWMNVHQSYGELTEVEEEDETYNYKKTKIK